MRGDPRNPSETAFRATVIEAAQRLGWKIWSVQDDVYKALFVAAKELGIHINLPAPGWPDLVMVRDGRLLFVELKSNTGTVRDEQWDWLEALGSVPYPVETMVIRPRDWDTFRELLD